MEYIVEDARLALRFGAGNLASVLAEIQVLSKLLGEHNTENTV
jgi:hypothetical protein